jgi:DNA-binding ferritin-like protein
MMGMAETAIGMLFGRRRSFSSVQSKSRMRRKAKDKLQESREDLEALDEDYGKLEAELKEALDELTNKWDEVAHGITTKEIKPRRTDIKVDAVLLAWSPVWVAPSGKRTTARG